MFCGDDGHLDIKDQYQNHKFATAYSGVASIEATEAVASVKKNNCINKKINVNCSNNIFIT